MEKSSIPADQLLFQPPPEERILSVDGSFTFMHDNNINHLLTNLDIDSNRRLPDDILIWRAGLELYPTFLDGALPADFAVTSERYDFQSNSAFSYYNHALAADVYPPLAKNLDLDIGGFLDWTGDDSGIYADDVGGSLGIIWRAPHKFRIKTGYEYERSNIRLNSSKDSDTHTYYLSIGRRLYRGHQLQLTYRLGDSQAVGPNFSYQTHSLRLRWSHRLARRLNLHYILSYQDRPYHNVDTRFLTKRHDQTSGATLKAILRLLPGVNLFLSYQYLQNHSNVQTKRYYDQISSIGLEGRY